MAYTVPSVFSEVASLTDMAAGRGEAKLVLKGHTSDILGYIDNISCGAIRPKPTCYWATSSSNSRRPYRSASRTRRSLSKSYKFKAASSDTACCRRRGLPTPQSRYRGATRYRRATTNATASAFVTNF